MIKLIMLIIFESTREVEQNYKFYNEKLNQVCVFIFLMTFIMFDVMIYIVLGNWELA